MTDDESINETSAQEKRDEAFIAAPFHWREIELKALSVGREGDWLQHCRRIGLPPLHEVINTGEGFLAHAQRLLFFCAHEPRVWLAVWMKGGVAAPIILETMITTWADKHIKPGDQIEVLKLALEIYDRSRATQAHRVTEDDENGDEKKNEFPSTRCQYIAILCKTFGCSPEWAEYDCPQEKGWAACHSYGISQGSTYEWPEQINSEEEELRRSLRERGQMWA